MEQLYLVSGNHYISGDPYYANKDALCFPELNCLLECGATVKSVTPLHGSDNSEAFVLLEVPAGIDLSTAARGRASQRSRSLFSPSGPRK